MIKKGKRVGERKDDKAILPDVTFATLPNGAFFEKVQRATLRLEAKSACGGRRRRSLPTPAVVTVTERS